MKVLIIHTEYKFRGGEDGVVQEEIKLLNRNGIRTRLLLFKNDGHQLLKLLALPFNLSAYWRVRKAIKAFKPDVVHVHNLHFAASASVYYAVKSMKLPLVHTLHNYRLICPSATLYHQGQLFLDGTRKPFSWQAIRKGVYRESKLLTAWLSLSSALHHWINTAALCNRYIALTDFSKNLFAGSYIKVPADKISVKPNFVNHPEHRSGHRQNHFLYVGRLTEEKGINTVLKAFAGLDCELHIAGDGPLVDEVTRYAADHANISYYGRLNAEQIQLKMQEAKALIFPSLWYEGMPLTIIEAFANGLPVIASNTGAMAMMVSHGVDGLQFEAGNSADLRKKITEVMMLTQEGLASMEEQAYRTFQQQYSAGKNFDQLITIYRSVLKGQQNLTSDAVVNKPKSARVTYPEQKPVSCPKP